MPQFIFTMKDLRKVTPQGKEILKGIWLSFYGDAKIGVLGANGAGKSTLMKALLGLVSPTSGSVQVLGFDAAHRGELRRRLGYMPEHDCLPLDQTAADVVSTFGELSGLPARAARQRASDILDLVGLDEARFRPIGGFSTGMRQRTKLAQALVGDPELVLLDEPTAGLDPLGREEMLALGLWGVPSFRVDACPARWGQDRLLQVERDLIAATGQLADGTVTNHLVNWLSPMKERVTVITGELGTFVADTLTADLTFHANGSVKVTRSDIAQFRGVSEGDVVRFAIAKPEPLGVEHQNFRDAVLGKDADIVTMEQGLATLAVAEAMIQSANTGVTVTIGG